MNKLICKTILVTFYVMGFTFVGNAQPSTPTEPNDNPVPITGIEYLIAAGAAFGAKKIHDKKKK